MFTTREVADRESARRKLEPGNGGCSLDCDALIDSGRIRTTVASASHANGRWHKTAQRLIVERGDRLRGQDTQDFNRR